MSGQTDVKLLLVESAVSTSIPNSIALLAPQPISLLQQPSTETQVSSNSNIFPITCSAKTITTNFIHPNKKKRLLTFLTEQENSICSVNDNSQIILAPAPQKSEQILFNSAKPDQILINPGKTEPLNSSQQTLFIQPACVNTLPTPSIDNVKQEQTTLIINPPPPPKNESTLIINPEGTAATLITPVVSASANLPLLAPCMTPSILSHVPHVPLSSSPAAANILSHVSLSSSPAATNYTLVQSAPSVDIVSMNFPQNQTKSDQAPCRSLVENEVAGTNFNQYIEKVVCHKCRLCGYLVLNEAALKNHLIDEHEDVVVESEDISESVWLAAAVKHGIKLHCPFCSNTFNSGRSFQVHLAEDHELTDMEAQDHLVNKNKERKEKAVKALHDLKQKEREARKKRRQLTHEAYIDNNNVIRVR